MQGEKPRNEASKGKELAKQQGSHRNGEGAIERMTDRDRVKDRERYRQREMETMRGETKQVAWVIAWGI